MAQSGIGDKLVKDLKDDVTLKSARDSVSGAVDKAKSFFGFGSSTPAPAPKQDASWHNSQVDAANDSFRKAAEQPQPKPAPKATPKPAKSLPKYKDGTDYVPKTGPAILHKGEAVLTKEEATAHRANKVTSTQPHKSVSLHRALSHLRQGGLHRALGIPQDQAIPADRLQQAKNSDNPHIAQMARFAATMEGWHHE